MHPTVFQTIYEILQKEDGYISTKELARRLGRQTGRDLRGHGGVDGMLHQASVWIAQHYGMVIVRTMSPGGIKLSSDLKEIREAKAQWDEFSTKIRNVVTSYDEVERVLHERQARDGAQRQLALEM
jgi:hypothetical protein